MTRVVSPSVTAAIVGAVGIVLLVGMADLTRRDVRRSIEGVNHTLDVQRAFNLVLKGVLDAETGQRGYLLTGDETYLTPFRIAHAAMPGHLAGLARVTREDRHHQSRVAQLQTIVAARMGELNTTIDLAQRGERAAAVAVVASGRGRALMQDARALLDAAFVEEQSQLRQRQGGLDGAIFRRALLTGGMAAVLGVMLMLAFRLRARVQELEPLVTLCAWSKTVRHGDEWISFEEYLERQFGLRVTHGLSPEQLTKLLGERTQAPS